QEIDHLLFAALICLQERGLVRRNARRAGGVGIRQFWVWQQSLQRAITRIFHASDRFDFARIERQKQNVLKIVVVIRFAHRRELDHFGQSLLQFVSITVRGGDRGIARFQKFIVLVRSKTDIEHLYAVVEKRIGVSSRVDREASVK